MLRLLRIMPRLFKILLMAPLLVVVIALTWLLSTKEGTHLIASLANEHLEELSLDNVDGYLFGQLTADHVRWKNESVDVYVTALSVNWEPHCLFDASLCFDNLTAKKLDITVPLTADETEDNEQEKSTLPEIEMPIGIVVSSAKIDNIALKIGESSQKITNTQLTVQWIDHTLSIEHIVAGYQDIAFNGAGVLDFSLPWKSQLSGDANYLNPNVSLAFKLKGERLSFEVDADLNLADFQQKAAEAIALSAFISFDKANLPLNIKLESPTALLLPVSMDEPASMGESVVIDVNALSINTSLSTMSIDLKSDIKTPYWSDLSLLLDAQFIENSLIIKNAEIGSDNGQIFLQGKVDNSPVIPFDLALKVDGVALHTLPYSALINSELKISGKAGGEKPELDLIINTLDGLLNNKPVSANGRFNLSSQRINVEELVLKSGENQVFLEGELSAQQDGHQALKLTALLPEPELWLPGLSGAFNGDLSLSGAVTAMNVQGELKAEHVSYEKYTLGNGSLIVDIKQSAKQLSSVSLMLQELDLGELTFETIKWQLAGDTNKSELQGDIILQNYGVAKVKCELTYLASIEGECGHLSWFSDHLSDPRLGWINKKNIAFSVNPETLSVQLEPFCLTTHEGKICNREMALWQPEAGYTLSVDAINIPLQRLAYLKTDVLTLKGLFNASANVSQKPGETINADVMFNLTETDLSLALKESGGVDSFLNMTLKELSATLALHNDQLTLDTRLNSSQLGDAKSHFQLEDIGGKRGLSGNINVSGLNLSFLQTIIPSVEGLSGFISSDLRFAGSLDKPFIDGDFTLTEGLLKSDYFPETLRQINVAAQFNHQVLSYKGSFNSNGGAASLDGELDWQQQWQLKTSLKSEAFKITPASGIDLTIKPDLNLHIQEELVTVTGTLTLPKARIEIKTLPVGAKSVSPDTRIIGLDDDASSQTVWRYHSNINIVLGDDVYFRGFGVNTYLTGRLLLSQNENGTFAGTGQISTEDGFYTIWGQRLTVKNGNFIFNGPLDEPDLQLDAYRDISGDSIIVGVKVTGQASDPEVEFYSQPGMNESDVLHYLLTGQSPDGGSNSSSLLNNMVISAGLFGSSEITEKLASKVGVSDFQVATQSDEEGTNLELSGYISPDIYLRYGVSLYDDAKTMAMRYRLKQNLFVEAASGINSSLDIIYSFERR